MHWGEYIKTEDKRPLSVYLRWRDKQLKHIVLSSGSQYLLLSLCWVFSRDSYFWDRHKWFPEVVAGKVQHFMDYLQSFEPSIAVGVCKVIPWHALRVYHSKKLKRGLALLIRWLMVSFVWHCNIYASYLKL